MPARWKGTAGLALGLLPVSLLYGQRTTPQQQPGNQGFAHTAGQQIVDGAGREMHLRGTSLGNWMVTEGYMFGFDGGPQSATEIEALTAELLGPERSHAWWKQYREQWFTRADARLLRDSGANTLRIPLHYKFFTTDDAEGFALLDRVVGWCGEEGIGVILDLHAAPGGQTGTNIDDSVGYPWLYRSAPAQEELIRVWQRLATHFRDNQTVIGYDLLNEPVPQYPEVKGYSGELEGLYKRIAAAVRPIDPHHILFLGGAQWDTNFAVFGPPFDANMAYTFHFYWTPAEEAELAPYLEARRRANVPMWLGESGENTDEWIARFRALLDREDIGWTFWPYKKLGKSSAFVTVRAPEGWDQIVAFARLPRGTDAKLVEVRLKARPEQAVIDRAFAQLLQDLPASEGTVNAGYLHALGLTVPAETVAR